MADEIYLKTGELSSALLRKAVSKAENAQKKAGAAGDEAHWGHSWSWGGNTYQLFSTNAESLIWSADSKLEEVLGKLEKLAAILESGPEAMKEIDRKYKSDLKDWRKSGNHGEILWIVGGGATAGATNINSNKSPEDKYRDTVDRINKAVPVGQTQETEHSGSGLCTYSATTTLLRRKEAADGKEPSFDFGDVHKTNGGNGQIDSDGRWPDSEYAFGRKYTSKDGQTTYQMSYEDGNSSNDRIVELLKDHPEGIMIWSPSSGGFNHAIVITDYEVKSDGSIQFYADDPVNNKSPDYPSGRVPLEQTWFYSQNNNIIGTAVRVAYLD